MFTKNMKEKRRLLFGLCIIATLMVVTIYALFFSKSITILNKIDKPVLIVIFAVLMGLALNKIFSIPGFQKHERMAEIITNSMILLMGVASIVLVVFEPRAWFILVFSSPLLIMALVSLIKTINEISNERKVTKNNTTE